MTDNLSHLPVVARPHVQRHVFGQSHLVKRDPSAGRDYDQTERACVCGVVKITVHGEGGSAWREWRLPGSPTQFNDALGAPRCTSTSEEAT